MRLFVAVEVPDVVRDEVAAAVEPVRSELGRVRWVDPSRYHLTVEFLGTGAPDSVPAVVSAIGSAVLGRGVFSLTLDGRVGTFGRRVLWAGLEPSPALAALASAVRSSLSSVGVLPDDDRLLSAHLTLARSGRHPIRAAAVEGVVMPRMSWDVRRVVLLRSAGGYEVVEAFPLVGDA